MFKQFRTSLSLEINHQQVHLEGIVVGLAEDYAFVAITTPNEAVLGRVVRVPLRSLQLNKNHVQQLEVMLNAA